MSYLEATGIVVVISAFLAVFFATVWALVEGGDWNSPRLRWGTVATGTLIMLASLVVGCVESDEEDDDTCLRRGGTLIQVGTEPQVVGRVIIDTPVYECGIIREPG